MTLVGPSRGRPSGLDSDRRAIVPIGELVVAGSDTLSIAAFGLGSCVALGAWDPTTRIGGLAHFMLPTGARPGLPAKYVDTGVAALLQALVDRGAAPRRSQFKAAGGAAMFVGVGGGLEVGRRNVDALRQSLAASGLRLSSQDLGGVTGRSVDLNLQTGQMSVRTIHGTSIL